LFYTITIPHDDDKIVPEACKIWWFL